MLILLTLLLWLLDVVRCWLILIWTLILLLIFHIFLVASCLNVIVADGGVLLLCLALWGRRTIGDVILIVWWSYLLNKDFWPTTTILLIYYRFLLGTLRFFWINFLRLFLLIFSRLCSDLSWNLTYFLKGILAVFKFFRVWYWAFTLLYSHLLLLCSFITYIITNKTRIITTVLSRGGVSTANCRELRILGVWFIWVIIKYNSTFSVACVDIIACRWVMRS